MRQVALISLISLLLISCESEQKTQKTETTVPVLIAKPVIKDIPIYIESIGTLHPSIFLEIFSQVNGVLTEILVHEGQWIEVGTSLFKIDPKLYEIKVQEAEAQMAIDQATFVASQKKQDRYKKLNQKDLISHLEWESIEAEIARAKSVVELDQARLNSAKLNLQYCTAISPIAGRVGKIDTRQGSIITSGHSPIITLSQIHPLVVEFSITEKEFPKLTQNNLTVEVQPLCSYDSFVVGSITFIDNHFDAKTGQMIVRGNVNNPEYKLRPGQNVRVRIPVGIISNAKLIPQKAIRYNQEGPYLYTVLPDNTVGVRQLQLGSEQDREVIVLEGLDSSEQVVTDGHLRLFPGLKVEIKS